MEIFKKWPITALNGPSYPSSCSAFESIYIFRSNHSVAVAKSEVMTTVDGAVTVNIILAGIFEWINPQSLLDRDFHSSKSRDKGNLG